VTLDWVHSCGTPIACDALRAGDAVLFGTLEANVHALRLRDGAELWHARLGKLAISSLQMLDARSAVAGVGVGARGRGRGLLASLRVSDGAVGWTWNAAGTVTGAVAVEGSRLYCGTLLAGGGGDVTCIEHGRRKPLWRRAFAEWINGVLVHGGRVFAPSMDGHLHCLDAGSGEVRWSFGAHGLVTALPLVHRGRLYFGAHDAVFYALDLDGRMAWRAELADRMTGGAAAFENTVIFGGWDGHVRSLDAETGAEHWAHDAVAPIVATPLVVDDRVYIGTDGGRMLGLDARTGGVAGVFPPQEPLLRELKTRPIVVDDRLLFGAYDGGAYSVRIERPGPRF
jgi:outer membrane protein assembly factor BamB